MKKFNMEVFMEDKIMIQFNVPPCTGKELDYIKKAIENSDKMRLCTAAQKNTVDL